MKSEQEIFVENMKYFRNQNDISQQELAKLCNVSVGTIGNIESYISKPSFDMIINISRQLNISPDYLFRDRSKKDEMPLLDIQKEKILNILEDKLRTSINESLADSCHQIKILLDCE